MHTTRLPGELFPYRTHLARMFSAPWVERRDPDLVIDAGTRPQQRTKRRYLKIGLRQANSYATLGHLRVHLERRNLAIGMSWRRPDARRPRER